MKKWLKVAAGAAMLTAVSVNAQSCGCGGARHARSGPEFVSKPVALRLRLSKSKTYGYCARLTVPPFKPPFEPQLEAGNIAAAPVIYGLPAVRPVMPMRQNRKQQMMASNGVVGVPLRPSPKGLGSNTRARPASSTATWSPAAS